MNRLMIPVRLPNCRIYDLLVDDCMSFTVGHIKAFARTVDGVEPFHNCEVSAILNDRVVADNDILGDIMADVGHGVKLVLARTESQCFTAATSCKGTLVVLQSSSDGSHCEHIQAMSNGKKLFCGQSISTKDEEFVSLVQNRRQPEQPPPGIKIMPHHDDLSELRGHRYKSITSRFSSPTPSVSSMTTMHPNDCSSWASLKVQSDGKEQELPKMPPKSCLAKRPSSVRFHTGNSAANLEELERGIPPTGDAAATPGQLEEDSGSTLAEDEDDHDGEQTPGRRQRSKSDSSRIKTAAGEESGEHRRPKSCPAVPADRASILKFPIVPRCDSESGLSRVTHISEDLRRDEEGNYIYRQNITSEARLTPDLVTQDFVQKKLKNVSGSLSHTVVAVPPILPVPQIRDQQCQALVSPTDPAYKYVKECVINYLAQHLGDSGNKFVRALQVPQTEIDSANHKYPREMFEKYFHLLRYWLTMSGSNATVQALRDVLVSIGRKDIADEIKKLDIPQAAPEPSSSEQASSPATPDRPGPDVDAVD